jgi:hypothetical protein
MKTCFKCHKRKPLTSYYAHKAMKDGLLGKCKACTKKDVKLRYVSEEGSALIRAYEKRRCGEVGRKMKVALYQKKRNELHPGKAKARRAVNNAIRDGRLEKKPCERCFSPKSKSQAHHRDYRSPLKVIWLCFWCHRTEHGQRPF